ncbi:MAG: hypothetical protein ABEJ98_03020 [Candidatus Nanohaloarchaea archaeon]
MTDIISYANLLFSAAAGQILSGMIGGLMSLIIVEVARRPKIEIQDGIWEGERNSSNRKRFTRSVRIRNCSLEIPFLNRVMPRDSYQVRRRPAIDCTATISFKREEIDTMSYPIYLEPTIGNRKREMDLYSGQTAKIPLAVFFKDEESLYIPDRKENSPADSSKFEKRKFKLIIEAKENIRETKEFQIEEFDPSEKELEIKELNND